MITVREQPHALACMEVWGGNCSVTRSIELPDLTAWVYSRPAGEEDRGGDVHYLSVCGQAVLSRVVLADVSGHGSQVSAPAQVLHALMREHINTWDQNAGHLPPLWYRSRTGNWNWLDEDACEKACGFDGIPVGLIAGTNYRQTLIRLEPADIIVLYTDGITEAADASGEMLGRDRLIEWIRASRTDCPETVGQFLVSRLGEFRKENLIDDETIIAIQRGNYS